MKTYQLCIRILGAATMAWCLSAFALGAEGHFDRTLQVSGSVDLDIQTGSGTITVRPGSNSSVHVSGTIRPSNGWDGDQEAKIRYLETHPPIEQDGNHIRVGRINDEELQRHVSISYEVEVPAAARVHSASGSGDQQISGVSGPVEASSGSGSLKLESIGDSVRVSTGSGRIDVQDVKGALRASTGSGEIRAEGVAGALHASTGSGSVDFRQTAPGEVEVSTGSGTVHLEGIRGSLNASTASGNIDVQGEGEGSWHLSAASGNLTVRLPSQQGFTMHAQTVSGSIHTARPMEVQSSNGEHEIRGTVGGGGFLLDVNTASGNISIE